MLEYLGICRNWCRCKYWLTPALPQDTELEMFCISSRTTRFFMPAGVGTGLEPRTSVGPLASDVGLKETHLLVDPGLLGERAITSSLGLKPPSEIKGLELQFCRDFCPESLLPLSWKRPCSLSYSSGCSFTNSTSIFLVVSKCSTNPGSLGC